VYLKIDRIPLNPLLQHSIIPIFQFNRLRWPWEPGFSGLNKICFQEENHESVGE
jgi:hypothetical protein